MKTSKPEVQRYDNMGCPEQICRVDTMYKSEDGDYVLYEDYEAMRIECKRLQAEYEQLISYTKNGIECFANPCAEHSGINTPPFSEFQERYGRLCLVCVVDECEELRTALSESQANDRQAMYYLNQIRRMVGGHDFPDMVERCRELVK